MNTSMHPCIHRNVHAHVNIRYVCMYVRMCVYARHLSMSVCGCARERAWCDLNAGPINYSGFWILFLLPFLYPLY